MILDWDCQHFGEPVDDKPLVAGVPTLKAQQYEMQDQANATWIMYKFTGCTPNATIGTLFVRVGLSWIPNSTVQGLFVQRPVGMW